MAKSALVRHRRRRRRNPDAAIAAPRSSSSAKAKDFFLHEALPAFGAYALTRLVGRVVYSLTARRYPRFAKHASALSGIAMVGLTYYGADKWKRTQPYEGAMLMGSALAALQGVVRTYVPKYGWIVTDPRPEDVRQLPAAAQAAAAAEAAETGRDEFSYLEDEVEATGAAPAASHVPNPHVNDAEDELTADEQAAYDGALVRDSDHDPYADYYSGSFAN